MNRPDLKTIRIREGKEKQLVRHHPWVFNGAVDEGASAQVPEPSVVRVADHADRFIAFGWIDAKSHILIRLLSWDEDSFPDESWWVNTIRDAVRRRLHLFAKSSRTNTFRLIHGEADFLPGIAVDIFGRSVVVVVSARVGWDHRHLVVSTLQRLLNPSQIIVETDGAFCGIEQMKEETERYVSGSLSEDTLPSPIRFREHGLHYALDPMTGQKSGFFCDQRENRLRVAGYANDRVCLDAFCYTGAFSLNLLANGARSVTAVDSSKPALERFVAQFEDNLSRNVFPADSREKLEIKQADVFTYLREIAADHFDLMVLDPPKLAQTKRQVEGALRAYKDLNRLAIQKIRNGGIVASFSCSSGVSREQLRTVIAWAAKDVGREVQILETLGQGPDHPIRLSFPESEYLKGYIYQVL